MIDNISWHIVNLSKQSKFVQLVFIKFCIIVS